MVHIPESVLRQLILPDLSDRFAIEPPEANAATLEKYFEYIRTESDLVASKLHNPESITAFRALAERKSKGSKRYDSLKLEKEKRKAARKGRFNPKTRDSAEYRFRPERTRKTPFFRQLKDPARFYEAQDGIDSLAEDDGLNLVFYSSSRMSSHGNWFIRSVPWLTKSDLKPNASKKSQGRKEGEHRSRNQRHSVSNVNNYRKKAFKQKNRKKTLEFMKAPKYGVIPSADRVVYDIPSFAKAFQYVAARKAKSQQFWHPNMELNEALRLMLGYVQSRVDRGLEVNLKEITLGKNSAVNSRLASWAASYGRRVITIPSLFKGRFYGSHPERGHRFSFVHVGSRITISQNYPTDGRYVTTYKEFLRAVRQTLKGEVKDIGHYHILDPVSTVTLEWCIWVNKHFNREAITEEGNLRVEGFNGTYLIKPEQIASLKLPELRRVLKQHRLFSSANEPRVYTFGFKPSSLTEKPEYRPPVTIRPTMAPTAIQPAYR